MLSLVMWIVLSPHRGLFAGVAAVAAGLGAGVPGSSLADYVVRTAQFLARSRWTPIELSREGATWRLVARGTREFRLVELHHDGRLDLSGEDASLDRDVTRTLERIALNSEASWVTWHLFARRHGATALLALPGDAPTPRLFLPVDESRLAGGVGGSATRAGWLLERWNYVRDDAGVAATFLILTSPATSHEAVLGELMPFGVERDATIAVRVESNARARARAGRQTHRWRANVAMIALGGFRQRASTDAATVSLESRERRVIEGRALLDVAVMVVVRGRTPRELELAATALRRDAARAGARLARGNGRHALWYCAHLFGSPAWNSL